jgi:hypothetical protein
MEPFRHQNQYQAPEKRRRKSKNSASSKGLEPSTFGDFIPKTNALPEMGVLVEMLELQPSKAYEPLRQPPKSVLANS